MGARRYFYDLAGRLAATESHNGTLYLPQAQMVYNGHANTYQVWQLEKDCPTMIQRCLLILFFTAWITACAINQPPTQTPSPEAAINETPRLTLETSAILPIRAEQALLHNDVLILAIFGKSFGGSPDIPFIEALDARTNKLLWRIQQEPWTGLSADDKHLFVLTEQGIWALSLVDGSTIWRSPIQCRKYESFKGCINTEILPAGGKLFFATDTTLYTLNAKDGSLLWTYALPTYGIDPFKPATALEFDNEYRTLAYEAGCSMFARDTPGKSWPSMPAVGKNFGIFRLTSPIGLASRLPVLPRGWRLANRPYTSAHLAINGMRWIKAQAHWYGKMLVRWTSLFTITVPSSLFLTTNRLGAWTRKTAAPNGRFRL